MSNHKKVYAQPSLTVYGNVETITQQGGGLTIDVPLGTSIGAPGGVTGPVS